LHITLWTADIVPKEMSQRACTKSLLGETRPTGGQGRSPQRRLSPFEKEPAALTDESCRNIDILKCENTFNN